MLCPNCDHTLNALGCQACGWKHGMDSTRHEAVNPYRLGAEYPSHVNFPAGFANRIGVDDIRKREIQARDALPEHVGVQPYPPTVDVDAAADPKSDPEPTPQPNAPKQPKATKPTLQ